MRLPWFTVCLQGCALPWWQHIDARRTRRHVLAAWTVAGQNPPLSACLRGECGAIRPVKIAPMAPQHRQARLSETTHARLPQARFLVRAHCLVRLRGVLAAETPAMASAVDVVIARATRHLKSDLEALLSELDSQNPPCPLNPHLHRRPLRPGRQQALGHTPLITRSHAELYLTDERATRAFSSRSSPKSSSWLRPRWVASWPATATRPSSSATT